MTRVSSFGQTEVLIQAMLRNQGRIFEDQMQITTGKKSQDFAGLGGDTVTLLGARDFRERTSTFIDTIKTVDGRLGANDLQLNGILEAASDFRQEILTIIAAEEAAAFDALLENSFSFIVGSLNTRIGGQHIFSGSKTDTPPVNSSSIADLVAAAAATDLFENDDAKLRARISDSVEIEFGITASDIATTLFESIKRIADFHAGGGGPMDGALTAAQNTFLVGELQLLDQAIDDARQFQVINGLAQQRIEGISAQHVDTTVFLDIFVSDVEDANIAEAISRLNLDQVSLEASFRTFSTISSLNILRFL
jgi:flagellar hook-associated protein 3 FlgL